jgi:hypothetical protein
VHPVLCPAYVRTRTTGCGGPGTEGTAISLSRVWARPRLALSPGLRVVLEPTGPNSAIPYYYSFPTLSSLVASTVKFSYTHLLLSHPFFLIASTVRLVLNDHKCEVSPKCIRVRKVDVDPKLILPRTLRCSRPTPTSTHTHTLHPVLTITSILRVR